jgi:predicted phosphoribosyltransferase
MEADLRRRERLLRGNSPALRLQGTTTLVADDGSATAADLRSAVLRLRTTPSLQRTRRSKC